MNLPAVLFLLLLVVTSVPYPVSADSTQGTGQGYITVINPPTADFFASTRYGSSPFTVSFSDSSLGYTPLTYRWDFGDGTSSAMQNPTHTYRNDGEYSVSLTVTNRYGTDTATKTEYIGVGTPPVPDFTSTPREGTLPLTIEFSDRSGNRPETWIWNFGDGSQSSEQNPSHTYLQPGIYPVSLTVSNQFGSNTLSIPAYINVSSPAPAGATVLSPLPDTKKEGIIGLILEARGSTVKNLPAAAFIPPEFMALAAMLTSLGIIFIQIVIANIGAIMQMGLKGARFFADLFGSHAVEKISEKEIEARRIAAQRTEQHFFGLSASEVIIVEVAVIAVAFAFLLADRADLTLEMVLIYICVGAVSVVLHDFAHRYFATKHGYDADIRFWGLGTIIMFLTAWLFGNAFAQSYRNLVNRNGDSDEDFRKTGLEMVAGPVVSIILMFLFLAMVPFGGLWAIAGGIGFIINLITAVYSLMPISTMDGPAIWRWNRSIYLMLLIPMIAFYFITFMLE